MKRLTGSIGLSLLGLAACATGDVPGDDGFVPFETSGEGDGDPGDGDPGDGDPGDGDGEPGDGDGEPEACGNGVIDGGEQCDGGELGGATCMSEGFGGGGIQCTDSCVLDTSNCTACGNGSVDDGEECDGADLGRNTSCADLGLGGTDEPLGCTDACAYDFGQCSGCGDGVVTDPEQCEPAGELLDKAELDGETCMSLGFDDGLLDCTEGCTFNTASCYSCGDAVQQGQEQCDGADFDDKTCADYVAMNGETFDQGSLSCMGDCTIDTGNCSLCGDGIISGAEICDGAALDGQTCQTQNFDGGTLACKADCSGFELASCTDCGDGVIEGAEQCDFNNLDGESCTTQGFSGGTLGCTLGCLLDTSGCANNVCGDGTINGMDQCDCGNQGQNCTAAQLNNQTCATQGFDGGALACNSPNNCSFNTGACYECGDGNINPGEQCDGNNLSGQTCITQGFGGGGALSCTAGCQFNTSACVAVANPYTVCAVNLNLPVPDNVSTQSIINVPANGTITDVDVSVNLLHTWVGDVDIVINHGATGTLLDRPGTTTVDDLGCSGDHIDATFDDEGNVGAEDVCSNNPAIASPPNYDPVTALSLYDGTTMNGNWTLTITDHETFDSGTLVEWCVTISWQ